MSIFAFLISCGFGAVVGLVTRPSTRGGRLISLAALLGAFVAALFIGSSTTLNLGDVTLAGSRYAGLFLACVAGSALLLCVVSMSSGWNDEFAPAALLSLAGLAVALTATDAGVAMMAGAALVTSGALLMVRGAPRSDGVDGRLAEMRTVGVVSAAMLFGALVILHPSWTGPDSPVFVLAFIGLSLALAVRSGAVPFHVPATHLRRTATPLSPALLLVWIPAGLGLVIIGWSATTFGIKNDTLNWAVALLQSVAIATLVLGALAALVHDELEEIATYSIVADAGFVLLALSARSDAAAEPARLWLLVFVAGKTALVAWTAAVSRAYGESNVTLLRGWMRRTPLLGAALIVIAVATVGWPGAGVYEARSTLIRLALPGQLQFLFAGSILLSAVYYVRLLAVGLLPQAEAVKAGLSERPHLGGAVAGEVAAEVAGEVAAASEATPAAESEPEAAEAAAKPAAKSAATKATAAATAATKDTAAATAATTAAATAAAATTTATVATEPGSADATPADATPADTASSPAGPSRLSAIWHLNRTLEVSLVVVGGAILAAALAFGSLGAGNAARGGIPLDTAAHATPAPPRATPSSAAPASKPTLAPHPTAGQSGSASPSIGPSSSLVPIKTSGPARDNTD